MNNNDYEKVVGEYQEVSYFNGLYFTTALLIGVALAACKSNMIIFDYCIISKISLPRSMKGKVFIVIAFLIIIIELFPSFSVKNRNQEL